jgi:hypothetical protein
LALDFCLVANAGRISTHGRPSTNSPWVAWSAVDGLGHGLRDELR